MGCSDHVPSLDFFFLFLEDQSHFFNILILLLLYVCAHMHVSTRMYIGAQGEVREQLCGVDFLVSSFYIGSGYQASMASRAILLTLTFS